MLVVIQLIALAFSIILHEVAHGYAAYKLGDPSAKDAHRLTLNPLRHIDPIGSIVLPLVLLFSRSPVLFGWAKPVPFNPSFFRNPRQGIMIVGAAGPATNLILAFACGLPVRYVMSLSELAALFMAYMCITNIVLGVFNLIPIPPLDGSRILLGLLPQSLVPGYLKLERFGFLIIFLLLSMGALNRVVNPVATYLLRLILDIR
jgi:Zn-dependent protease